MSLSVYLQLFKMLDFMYCKLNISPGAGETVLAAAMKKLKQNLRFS